MLSGARCSSRRREQGYRRVNMLSFEDTPSAEKRSDLRGRALANVNFTAYCAQSHAKARALDAF